MDRKTQVESKESGLQSRLETRYGGALSVLIIASGVGAVAVIVYALQAQSLREFVAAASGGLLICGASLLIGVIIGFLFGIPRSLEESEQSSEDGAEEPSSDQPGGKARYKPNTNLEEISDWLTKILVGVGLTQLSAAPAALRDVGEMLAPGLGNFTGSEVFAIGILVFFSTCGFFMSFLWTRLTLPRLYIEADYAAAERRGIRIGEEIGAERKEREFLETVDKASEKAPRERFALWVDDRPSNNTYERSLMERLLGLKFTNVLSTKEALQEVERSGEKYSVVISDMARPGDRRAGYTLLEKLREKGYQKPFIIYSSSGRPEHDIEARRRSAEGSTNSAQRLIELVSNSLEDEE